MPSIYHTLHGTFLNCPLTWKKRDDAPQQKRRPEIVKIEEKTKLKALAESYSPKIHLHQLKINHKPTQLKLKANLGKPKYHTSQYENSVTHWKFQVRMILNYSIIVQNFELA